MTRLALFAISLVLVAGTSRAQQVPHAPLGTTPADSANESPSYRAMTPREQAEMRADLFMARKQYEEAIKTFQTILIDDPHNAKVLNFVGMAYQQIGNGDQAEHYYKLAVRADKADSNALNNLGTVEYSEQRYGKAIKYYRKAIDKGNALATVYTNLGYAYCGVKEYPKAMAVFAQALALDPDVFDHKGNTGSILQQRSSPDPGALHYVLAKSYGKIGDAERAARYLKMARDEGYKEFRAAEKDPDFAKVIKDPRVQQVLKLQPAYASQPQKPATN
ncbi:MAG TPA: tetratricopeptide repeat protein [Candidatus Acidoferrales bacterium]|jgi:tetratricopeptide (TPR) repeat protein|nr:tetratricopeptide repeat protein [Candidatus Acidoferrales bacterium]